MYVIMYREDLDEFEMIEGEGHEGNISDIKAFIDPYNAEELTLIMNNWIAKGQCTIRKCKTCGLYFFIGRDEEDWFKHKGFDLPKSCQFCRDNKRQAAKSIYDGLYCYVCDEIDGRNYCVVSGDACMFPNPDAKACAEQYHEGPLALNY